MASANDFHDNGSTLILIDECVRQITLYNEVKATSCQGPEHPSFLRPSRTSVAEAPSCQGPEPPSFWRPGRTSVAEAPSRLAFSSGRRAHPPQLLPGPFRLTD